MIFFIFILVVFVGGIFFLFDSNDKLSEGGLVDKPKNKSFHYYVEHWFKTFCYAKFMNPETEKYEYLMRDGDGDFSKIIRFGRFKELQRETFQIDQDFDRVLFKFKSIEDVKYFNKQMSEKVDAHNKQLKQKEFENKINNKVNDLNKHLN